MAETLVLAELLDFDTSIDHTVVVKRTFQQATLRTHPHGRSDVVLTLTFNEPVREVQDLTLGGLDVKAVALEEANGDQTEWTFTIPAAEVTGAPLGGEVVLTVKAIDENEHWPHDSSVPGPSDCRNTGHLDETPPTPAKRIHPEHTEVLEPGNENLLVEPGLSLPWADASTKPEFACECENGDHRLLFGTTPPTVTRPSLGRGSSGARRVIGTHGRARSDRRSPMSWVVLIGALILAACATQPQPSVGLCSFPSVGGAGPGPLPRPARLLEHLAGSLPY